MNKLHDIDYLLDEVVTLPSLPTTVQQVINLVNDPHCPLTEVAKAISTDPPLALKTLRLVNTAYYGLGQEVINIDHAVVLLGVKVIKNLAFTASLFDMMQGGLGTFFRHSVACGTLMRLLVANAKDRFPAASGDDAFVYGLLHDIGKIVFEQFLPKESALVAAVCKGRGLPWYQAERETIGVDHAQLGTRLAQRWKLPDPVLGAISGHHDLAECENPAYRPLAALVAIADHVICQCGIPSSPAAPPTIDDNVWKLAGITGKTVAAVIGSFLDELPAVDELVRVAG